MSTCNMRHMVSDRGSSLARTEARRRARRRGRGWAKPTRGLFEPIATTTQRAAHHAAASFGRGSSLSSIYRRTGRYERSEIM